LLHGGVRRNTHLEPGTYQKCGSKDSDIVTYVDNRNESSSTEEKRAEAVDISDGLTAVPAVIRTSTVNSNKSGPASKLSLCPIKANAKVADDNTAADGLKKKAAADWG
jgi:hypothetical protein